jgi:hypothetical protein
MNRNLKRTIWVLALGVAFTGLGTTRLAAAVPAQQGQDQDRNQNQDRNNNQYGDGGSFQQGLQDGQHDRQFGGNRDDHRQPNDANDLRAYQDGYRQGFRNTSSEQQTYRTRSVNYFEQGVRDGQHDRQYGGNRRDHQQPNSGNDRNVYRDGYRHGFQNLEYNNQQDYRSRRVNYFERGLRDGQYDRQYGGNRRDHQQPNDANDLRAYRDGYKHGYRNIAVQYN